MALFSSQCSLCRLGLWQSKINSTMKQYIFFIDYKLTCTKTKSFKKSYFCTNSGLCAWNNRLMLVHRRISIHFMWVLSAVKAAVCPNPQKYCYAFKMSKASFLVPAKGPALRHQTSQQPPDSTAVSLCRFYRSWIS